MFVDRRLTCAVPSALAWVALGFVLRMIGLAATVVVAFSVADIVAVLLGGGTVEEVFSALVTIAVAVVVRAASIPGADQCHSRAAGAARAQLRSAALRAAVSRESSGLPADASQLVVSGIESLEAYFASYLPQLAYAVATPLVLFGVVLTLNPATAWTMLAITPVTFILIGGLLTVARKRAGGHFRTFGKLGRFFVESMEGLPTLVLYRRDEERGRRFNELSEDFRRATMRLLQMQLSSIVVMDLAAYGGAAATMLVAVAQVARGDLDPGAAFAVLLLSSEFFLPIRALGSAFHVAMTSVVASRRLFSFMDEANRSGAVQAAQLAERMTGTGVELSRVGFRYPDASADALDDVTMSAQPGRITAVVGESGSGKSTLVAIIAGLRHACAGTVTVGRVSVVAQGSYIFSGTIASNLRLALPDATAEQMVAVCRQVRLDEVVRTAEDLTYPIAEGGGGLSGGQRQKLAVARALLQDRPVMIFDEATSNIDADSEADLLAVMHELARDRTVIVVTHRVSGLLEPAAGWGDAQVIVLEHGKIVDAGSPAELDQRCMPFRRLARTPVNEEVGAHAH